MMSRTRWPAEQARPAAGLLSQDDVLGDGEVVDQHEVLVHHADAVGDGIIGVADRDFFATEEDLSLFCLV